MRTTKDTQVLELTDMAFRNFDIQMQRTLELFIVIMAFQLCLVLDVADGSEHHVKIVCGFVDHTLCVRYFGDVCHSDARLTMILNVLNVIKCCTCMRFYICF